MYHNFLIHSSANVNLGYYYVLVIVNSDAVNTEVVVELLSRVWVFCDPMDCSPPGFFIHGIFQARILEEIAIPSPLFLH